MADESLDTYVPSNEDISDQYRRLWEAHNERPVQPELWAKVIALAQKEEATPVAKRGAYGDMPLSSLLKLHSDIGQAKSPTDSYSLLARPSPAGDIWFDRLLGLSAPEVIAAVKKHIDRYDKWQTGLDLGTGTGLLARAIATNCQRVVTMDQNRLLLQIAKLRNSSDPGISHAQADVMNLPLDTNSIDLAVSSGLTGSFTPLELGMFSHEVFRVLKAGGHYIQAYPMPPGKDQLHVLERRSLANAKGILADMIVDIVNDTSQKRPDQLVDFRGFLDAFTSQGFSTNHKVFPEFGAVVFDFTKPPDAA